MAAQARQFLGNIAAVGEENDLLQKPLVRVFNLEPGLCRALEQRAAMMFHHLRREHADRLHIFLDRQRPLAQVGSEGIALLLAHLHELVERHFQRLAQGRPGGIRLDLGLVGAEDTRSAQHLVERHLARELQRFDHRLELVAVRLRRREIDSAALLAMLRVQAHGDGQASA